MTLRSSLPGLEIGCFSVLCSSGALVLGAVSSSLYKFASTSLCPGWVSLGVSLYQPGSL